ncbi:MAG: glycosyltransferase involved in cell wall biosynthesis [Myxococcota bacterium]|jgi:glycosyltransferase involved in cell wall biosynthesis
MRSAKPPLSGAALALVVPARHGPDSLDASTVISIIVPVHNDAASVQACIEGLQQQTDSAFEVVLVDDASTDATPAVLAASGYSVVTLPTNKGQAVARNAGVAAASGHVLIFLDADTLPPPDWVTTHRRLLLDHPDATMICSGYSTNLRDGAAAWFAYYEQAFRRRGLARWIDSASGANVAVRRTVFEEIGGFPEYYLDPRDTSGKACAVAEDSELGWLLARAGHKILWTPDNPVAHRFRGDWAGYMAQQQSYSRFLTISLFRYPDKLKQQGIYAGEQVLPQVAVIGLMMGAPVLAVAGIPGLLAAGAVLGAGVAWFGWTQRRFLAHLSEQDHAPSIGMALGVLLTSRAHWLVGILQGLWDGLWMNRRG